MARPVVNAGIKNVRKKGSGVFREGPHMLPSVSLMIAEGVLKSMKDLQKPFVTIINSYTNQIPGHAHLDVLGAVLKKELEKLGVNVWYANIGGAICDGIAMGHFGMKYSLASRELITDQIETEHVYLFIDACVAGNFATIGQPGWLMAIGSTTRTYTYDGTPEMGMGIFTFYMREALETPMYIIEDASNYAITHFEADTPGDASLIDAYTGDFYF